MYAIERLFQNQQDLAFPCGNYELNSLNGCIGNIDNFMLLCWYQLQLWDHFGTNDHLLKIGGLCFKKPKYHSSRTVTKFTEKDTTIEDLQLLISLGAL